MRKLIVFKLLLLDDARELTFQNMFLMLQLNTVMKATSDGVAVWCGFVPKGLVFDWRWHFAYFRNKTTTIFFSFVSTVSF